MGVQSALGTLGMVRWVWCAGYSAYSALGSLSAKEAAREDSLGGRRCKQTVCYVACSMVLGQRKFEQPVAKHQLCVKEGAGEG